MKIEIEAVAIVKNTRRDLSDDYWGGIVSEIELLPHIPESAFNEIENFSHLEIIFHFDKATNEEIKFHCHPRGNLQFPDVGIFCQRRKARPNFLGLTIVELVKHEGRKIVVKNIDAVDGTPIFDIKPVWKNFLPESAIKQPIWVDDLMKNYWKEKD